MSISEPSDQAAVYMAIPPYRGRFVGSQLLIDVLDAVHSRLFAAAVEDERFEGLLPHLDAIAEAVTQVRVEGSYK